MRIFVRRSIVIAAVAALLPFAAPGRADAVQGGSVDSDASYSVRVRIGDASRGDAIWACSGARVAADWVLTSATCLRESGAAPTTSGAAPLKTLTVETARVSAVAVHPSRDIALLRTEGMLQDLLGTRVLPLTTAVPVAGEQFGTSGYGRTSTTWVPMWRSFAGFQAGEVTATTVALSPTGSGGLCKGDAGGPVFRTVAGKPQLVGLVGDAAQGGCYGAPAGEDRSATAIRVDDLGPWVRGWTLDSGFEPTDPPIFSNTPAYSGAVSGVGGICCSLTGPELRIAGERVHAGTRSLFYAGKDNSSTKSFAYLKAYAAQNLTVTSGTILSYWIWPQGTSPATGSNSTCVAVDLNFSDGTHLRNLKAYTTNATDSHPARQCGKLTLNAWNQVKIHVGGVANGKKITQVSVGYEQAANTGGYRGFIDDIQLYQGCLPRPGVSCAFGAGLAAKSAAVATEVALEDPTGAPAGSTVEDFAYPDPDGSIARQNIKLIAGNGGLLLVDCAKPVTGAYGLIKVRSSNPDVGAGGLICFESVGGGVGLVTMEVPDVFSVRSDGINAGEGHPTRAAWRSIGSTETQTGNVPLGGVLPIGIGEGEGVPAATLLQLLVNPS
ncbi:MAG: trypsin-like serine protease [Jiangellaceae bacterium]